MENTFRFTVHIDYIQLNLPKEKCFLKFIVKNMHRQIQYQQQIKLTKRTRKSILNQQIVFSLQGQEKSFINKNIVICVIGISQQYVAFLGLVKINLQNALKKGDQPIKQNLQCCARQKGHLIYKIDCIRQNNKNSEIFCNKFKIQESNNRKLNNINGFENTSTISVEQNSKINKYQNNNNLNDMGELIQEYKKQIDILMKQNKELKLYIQKIKKKAEYNEEIQEIMNKLSNKYENSVSENIQLKQKFFAQMSQFQQRIEELQNKYNQLKSNQKQDVSCYILQQKIKNQQIIKKINYLQIQKIKRQVKSINYRPLQNKKSQNNMIQCIQNIDLQKQIKVLIKVNQFLKTEVFKKIVLQYFKEKQLDIKNMDDILKNIIKKIDLKQLIKQLMQQ